mgnify:CR=1 FL=1
MIGNGADHRTGTLSIKIKRNPTDSSPTEMMRLDGVYNLTTFNTAGSERLRIDSSGEIISYNGTLRRNVSDSSFTVSGDTASNTGANINLYGASHGSLANVFRVRTGSTERLRIQNDGKVGINITSPRALLDLGLGTDASTISNTAADYQLGLHAAQSATGDIGRNIAFISQTVGTVCAAINSVDDGSTDKTALQFLTGNSSSIAERLRITSAGKLQVKGTRGGNLQPEDDDTLQLYTKSTDNSTNRGSGITFYNHDNSGYEMGGTIQVAKENGNADDEAAYMRFCTRPAGSAAQERLRIYSGGQVSIRNTNATSFNTGGDDLVIGNATDGQDAGITLYSHSSDNGSIFFNDTASTGLTGLIQYRHSEDAMRFITATQERLRINSAGTVRIKRAVSTSLGNDSIFLAIGDTENGTNVNRMIGFGYNSNFGTSVYPASIGSVSYTHLTLPTKRIV